MKITGKNLFRLLKENANTLQPQLRLAIDGFNNYSLRLVPTNPNYLDDSDIKLLTTLRNHYVKSFLTEFDANDSQTASWLAKIVHEDDSRILFIIENEAHERLGYMGLAYINWNKSYVEADAIVSSGRTPKGLMTCALRALLTWAKQYLHLENVGVRVLSDNPALTFYKKMGFVETQRVPLRRTEKEGFIAWIEDSSLITSDRYLVHHQWNEH